MNRTLVGGLSTSLSAVFGESKTVYLGDPMRHNEKHLLRHRRYILERKIISIYKNTKFLDNRYLWRTGKCEAFASGLGVLVGAAGAWSHSDQGLPQKIHSRETLLIFASEILFNLIYFSTIKNLRNLHIRKIYFVTLRRNDKNRV